MMYVSYIHVFKADVLKQEKGSLLKGNVETIKGTSCYDNESGRVALHAAT